MKTARRLVCVAILLMGGQAWGAYGCGGSSATSNDVDGGNGHGGSPATSTATSGPVTSGSVTNGATTSAGGGMPSATMATSSATTGSMMMVGSTTSGSPAAGAGGAGGAAGGSGGAAGAMAGAAGGGGGATGGSGDAGGQHDAGTKCLPNGPITFIMKPPPHTTYCANDCLQWVSFSPMYNPRQVTYKLAPRCSATCEKCDKCTPEMYCNSHQVRPEGEVFIWDGSVPQGGTCGDGDGGERVFCWTAEGSCLEPGPYIAHLCTYFKWADDDAAVCRGSSITCANIPFDYPGSPVTLSGVLVDIYAPKVDGG